MIGRRRVASNTTGAATLVLSTVPHTTVWTGAPFETCGLQPVIPAVTTDVARTAARAVVLDFQRHLMIVRRRDEHTGSVIQFPVGLVLVAALASLRWGEVAALRRSDINLTAGTVSVRRQHVELDTGRLVTGPPKSRAGLRTVVIPAAILPAMRPP